MRYLRIFGMYFRIGAMGEMQYRFNFFVHLFQSILQLGMAIGGLAVVFTYTDTLGGWLPDEVLALVGVYTLVGGLIGLVVYPSMEQFIMSVRDGMLDFVLVKPVDAQLLNSLQSVDIWRLIDIALGLGVLIVALARLGTQVGLTQVVLFLGMLLTGSAIIYSFWTILATLSFWFVRVENILEIFRSMYEAGRWPITLYPPWLRFTLSFIVPVAFVTSVPVEALTGRLSPQTLVLAALMAAVLLVVSRLVWKRGLRQYSGASA
jgi:ABC-2 type transport system permease protein